MRDTISHLKVEKNKILYDPKEIANELNKYFVGIGSKLASKIAASNMTHRYFLKGRPLENTFFSYAYESF